jgi:hypothetical protein
MKITGYTVWQYDDGTVVSTEIEFDPERVFAYMRYGDFEVQTCHPDHRALLEHVLESVRDRAGASAALPPAG